MIRNLVDLDIVFVIFKYSKYLNSSSNSTGDQDDDDDKSRLFLYLANCHDETTL